LHVDLLIESFAMKSMTRLIPFGVIIQLGLLARNTLNSV